jgi:hypothetical protein
MTVQRVSVVEEEEETVTDVTTSASRRRPFLLFSSVVIHNCSLCFGYDMKILQCSEVIRVLLLHVSFTFSLAPSDYKHSLPPSSHFLFLSLANRIIMRRNSWRENCPLLGYFAASSGRERAHRSSPVKSNPIESDESQRHGSHSVAYLQWLPRLCVLTGRVE